jgi:hypothetical protein
MYFFYVDEAGNRDPQIDGLTKKGEKIAKDHIYVLTAVSLYEFRWSRFERSLNGKKSEYIDLIRRTHGLRLELADCEVKSNWVRNPKERNSRPFLANLTDAELTRLVELYYEQLLHHHMQIFAIVIDKRHLREHMDDAKIHRKSWELLLRQVERFLSQEHSKHQGVLITDDVSIQANRSLAMKHAYLIDPTSGFQLKNIVEMPLFVRSELSNGVQLADLVVYNIYRCFRYEDANYAFFQRILPHIWASKQTAAHHLEGLTIFPGESQLTKLRDEIGKSRAGT